MKAAEAEVEMDGVEGTAQDVDQYLTFIMADEEYGVDILSVKEIRNWDSATPIPKSPDHVRGVINLRGTIVPIIDLRQCFGMEAIEYGPLTVVLVLQVTSERGKREVGIVVDAVSDVYSLGESQVKPAPDMGATININFIKGLASIDEKMVILLNIDRLLNQEDFTGVSDLHQAVTEAVQAAAE
ncbi:MAG: purine-binding chemotaxis protein CheW [Candidatus Azotimanducaceae bacterium]|jgi:purine-binding chemotaxis protein CheW